MNVRTIAIGAVGYAAAAIVYAYVSYPDALSLTDLDAAMAADASITRRLFAPADAVVKPVISALRSYPATV